MLSERLIGCGQAPGPAAGGRNGCLPTASSCLPPSRRRLASSGSQWLPAATHMQRLQRASPRDLDINHRRCIVRTTAALPQQALGAAAKAAAQLPDLAHTAATSLQNAIDPGVLTATINASGKLFIICAAVGWLLRSGRIPNSTATVLSQVSFQLLIPCMLFSKVASTLAAQPDTTLLLGIAAASILQICIGAACGVLMSPLVVGRQDAVAAAAAAAQQQRSSNGGSGWQGRSSPAAASAIAASMAAASGAPLAAAALRPKQQPLPAGPAQMVAPSAAFGNSFTLPAVFLTTLLPAPLADRALGYAALFLLAWSPCLWSIGMALVGNDSSSGSGSRQQQQSGTVGNQAAGQQQQQDAPGGTGATTALARRFDPLEWRMPRVFDLMPDSFSGGRTSSSSSEQLDVPAPPSWAEQLAQHPAVGRLCQFAAQTLNPPVLAILFGTLVGLTPSGRALLLAVKSGGTAAAAGAAVSAAGALPPELGLLQAVLKATIEVIELLAAGTLATQTLVLAASLLQQPEGQTAAAAPTVGPATAATAAAAPSRYRRGWLSAVKQQLLPSDATEARALAVLSLTRFLLLPLATVGCLQALVSGGLLPPAMSDPVLLFVLLVEACMPSAQNLIILLQLSERTQRLAPGFARMLLKLYFYAILPVTLWVTAFATNLGIPVLR